MEQEVMIFVEIPTGSPNKYEVDHATGTIVLDHMLFTAPRYPADYGFIEGTVGEDSDALDALFLSGEHTFPGCRIRGSTLSVEPRAGHVSQGQAGGPGLPWTSSCPPRD
jgi:inorganic pyrophosphatase